MLRLLRSSPMLGQPAQTAVRGTCIFPLDKLTSTCKCIFPLDKLTPSKRQVRCPLLHPFVAPTLFWPQPLFPIITTLFAARLPLSHAHPASCLSQVHSFVLCVNNNIKNSHPQYWRKKTGVIWVSVLLQPTL